MLQSRALRRTHVAIQAHRVWLATFVTSTRRAKAPRSQDKDSSENTQIRRFKINRDSKPGKILRRRPRAEPATENIPALEEMRQALIDMDLKTAFALFGTFTNQEKRMLEPKDTANLAQCMHQLLRREKKAAVKEQRQPETAALLQFADKMVRSIRANEIIPSSRAHIHLLGSYKEIGIRENGIEFWRWLQAQGDEYLDPGVYGAAIELLAFDGASIEEMESLFEEALQRFPGNFAAYHVSPNAIIPDRERSIKIGGIKNILLQGILTARLFRGQARGAYMILDTTLRLYPIVLPPRFFSIFSGERPAAEAFTVLAMASRAGVVLPVQVTQQFFPALRSSTMKSPPAVQILARRQMLSLLYLNYGSSGTIRPNALNQFVILVSSLARMDGMINLNPSERKQVYNALFATIANVIKVFGNLGVLPTRPAFNAVISNVASLGHSKQIIDVTLSDMQSIELSPNISTRRSILVASGHIRDRDMLRDAWRDLVKLKADKGQLPEVTDIHLLIRSSKLNGCPEFAEGIAEKARPYLPEDSWEGIQSHLAADPQDSELTSDVPALDVPSFLEHLTKFNADLAVIEERHAAGTLTDLNGASPLTTIMPTPEELRLPDSQMRAIYDELTTEQAASQPAPTPAVKPTDKLQEIERSPTNIPLGDLRYENWKSINYLLAISEKSDRTYHENVDRAIAEGTPVERDFGVQYDDTAVGFGLSDLKNVEVEAVADEGRVRAVRDTILRLRGLSASQDNGQALD